MKMSRKILLSIPVCWAGKLEFIYLSIIGVVQVVNLEVVRWYQWDMEIEFEISDEDMEILKKMEKIESYDEFGFFPVYGGKLKGYSGKPGTEKVD